MKLVFIEARTGCTCCSDDNHYRGPYRDKESAERRIAYYKAPDSKYWPLASQFSKRGNYSITEVEAEEIPGDRIIIGDHVFSTPTYIEVNPDGTLNDQADSSEWYTNEL